MKKRVTKVQAREKARKAGVQRRVASALANFLKKANPAMKTCGAAVQRLKGGVLKITPIKANAGRGDWEWVVSREGNWGIPVKRTYYTKAEADKAVKRLRAEGHEHVLVKRISANYERL